MTGAEYSHPLFLLDDLFPSSTAPPSQTVPYLCWGPGHKRRTHSLPHSALAGYTTLGHNGLGGKASSQSIEAFGIVVSEHITPRRGLPGPLPRKRSVHAIKIGFSSLPVNSAVEERSPDLPAERGCIAISVSMAQRSSRLKTSCPAPRLEGGALLRRTLRSGDVTRSVTTATAV